MTVFVATPQKQSGTVEMRECIRRFLDRARVVHNGCQWHKCERCRLEVAGLALLVSWEEERG